MGVSILFYSLFAGLGGFVKTPEQMLLLAFHGWPWAWAECGPMVLHSWQNAGPIRRDRRFRAFSVRESMWASSAYRSWVVHFQSRPSRGVGFLSSRRFPAVLGLLVLTMLPESPKWLASRGQSKKSAPPLWELFRGDLLRPTLLGILLASVPLIGAWAGSKWMIPWADEVGGAAIARLQVDNPTVGGRLGP